MQLVTITSLLMTMPLKQPTSSTPLPTGWLLNASPQITSGLLERPQECSLFILSRHLSCLSAAGSTTRSLVTAVATAFRAAAGSSGLPPRRLARGHFSLVPSLILSASLMRHRTRLSLLLRPPRLRHLGRAVYMAAAIRLQLPTHKQAT